MKSRVDFKERLNRLRLYRSDTIGPVRFKYFLEKFGSATHAIDVILSGDMAIDSNEFQNLFGFDHSANSIHKSYKITKYNLAARDVIDEEFENLQKIGGQIILHCDEEYPRYLNDFSDSPPLLSVVGKIDLLKKESVAVVGSRSASAIGKKWAQIFAEKIGEVGFAVISGLARGIDAAAHLGSMKTGTIAVLGGGINTVYPEENRKIYQKISEEGLLISEFPYDDAPQSSFFPRRNKLISGISWGTVIVEAEKNSGSIITARHASEQGKEVFAVPNHPFDLRSQGTNGLLKEGAHLIENFEDFLSIYHHVAKRHAINPRSKEKSFSRKDAEQRVSGNIDSDRDVMLIEDRLLSCADQILSSISSVPISVDNIAKSTNLSSQEIAIGLIELELAEKIVRRLDGKICLNI